MDGKKLDLTYTNVFPRFLSLLKSIRAFHKAFIVQEWQYCQFRFICAVGKEQDLWCLQSWNILLLPQLLSNFTFTNTIWYKKKRKNIWEYKVGNSANIVNYVRLWKPRLQFDGKHVVGGKINWNPLLNHYGKIITKIFNFNCKHI